MPAAAAASAPGDGFPPFQRLARGLQPRCPTACPLQERQKRAQL
jgi:hypothetical protein